MYHVLLYGLKYCYLLLVFWQCDNDETKNGNTIEMISTISIATEHACMVIKTIIEIEQFGGTPVSFSNK